MPVSAEAKGIGAAIAQVRADLALSQSDFAAALGGRGGQVQVRRWERGEVIPSFETRFAIAELGGVDPAVLGVQGLRSEIPLITAYEAEEIRILAQRIIEITTRTESRG